MDMLTKSETQVFYHRTTREAADKILADGFRDGTDHYLTANLWSGVWLSNVPLDSNDGATGHVLLRVTLDLPEITLAEYEWVPEDEWVREIQRYREWLVPADVINPIATIEEIDDLDEIED